MQFELTILGSNGAIPAHNRFPSAQILNHNSHLFLIDCGEGTLFKLNQYGIKRGRLDNIFISHLHGDHFYGLMGLLTSFNLNSREHPLHIYAPAALEEIVNLHFKHSTTTLKFDLHFHPINSGRPEIVFENDVMAVTTIPLRHRIPTTGFLFREKKHLRKIISEKISEHKIPHHFINEIKRGKDFVKDNGSIIQNSELTLEPQLPRSYAYCSDTAYTESFVEQIKDVSLLYHEATFIHEHSARAEETFHSTSKQAAAIAQLAAAEKLLLGHFSARYDNLEKLLAESREIFPNTFLAEEGKTFAIEQSEKLNAVLK